MNYYPGTDVLSSCRLVRYRCDLRRGDRKQNDRGYAGQVADTQDEQRRCACE